MSVLWFKKGERIFTFYANMSDFPLAGFFKEHGASLKSVGNRLRHHVFGCLKVEHKDKIIYFKASRFKSVKKLSGRNCMVLEKAGFFHVKTNETLVNLVGYDQESWSF